MIKLSFSYQQSSTRLDIDGMPDLSIGHNESELGILSSWTLQLIGAPDLQGKKEHLQALMSVVFSYARHRISGVSRSFGNQSDPVRIDPSNKGLTITLTSSNEETEPLEIFLDDSEFADLVRCLDDLRLDPRVKIDWTLPLNTPLNRSEIPNRVPISHKLVPVFLASISLLTSSIVSLYLPLPPKYQNQTESSDRTMQTIPAKRK